MTAWHDTDTGEVPPPTSPLDVFDYTFTAPEWDIYAIVRAVVGALHDARNAARDSGKPAPRRVRVRVTWYGEE
jgi:hypothetical protein